MTVKQVEETMLAALQPSYGSADAIRIEQVPLPRVGPDDVRIQVRTASLNFGDRMVLQGRPLLFRPLAYGLGRPANRIAGMAAAGIVVEVGAAVTDWKVGDPVFGELGRGALAEHVLAKAGELARKPEAVTFEAAATIPVAGTTALQGLVLAGTKPGQRVLV
ncbi:MAG: alcohol dehydrogenase catalytic domain-containing protein, partial [Myxococcota bacterium]